MTGADPTPGPSHGRWRLVLALLALLYVVQSVYYARMLMPSGDMMEYLVAGRLAVTGQINLYDDRLPGNRPPLPFYVLGLTQLFGPSLLLARWTNIGLGVLTMLLTAGLARRLGGQGSGLLAGLFFVTQGVVVSGYASEGYFAFGALCLMLAVVILFGGDSAGRRALGVLAGTALFFVRSNLWPAVPFLFIWALRRAKSSRERVVLAGVVALPPLMFFAWDQRHLKLLAYVPVARRLVAPLGYVSALELDDRQALPLSANLFEAARLVRRHEFWVLAMATLAVILLWRALAGRRPLGFERDPRVTVLACFFVYMLGAQFVIYYWNWGWIMGYFLLFAPLVPVLLGLGFSALLANARGRPVARGLLIVLLILFVVPPMYFVRNPRLPSSPSVAKDSVMEAYRAAAELRRAVPADARVFFFGWNVVYYLSGLPQTYLQQAYDIAHLPAGHADTYTLRKSGFVPVEDIRTWLSVDADYAVIEPAYIAPHSYRWEKFHEAVVEMATLLDRHFERVGTVTLESPEFTFAIYRRKPGP
jgi:4-amino-4-deoxy-L-arabinose transferase-like glycosyltransferase